ncbi:MAG: flagellar hook-associated protein FlgL, partial [Salinisphaera sp.]|nr:flagellar hook-associated protein FlgL [Salinisphaera sp.]
MRLSTSTIYSLGTQGMLDQQSNISRIGQQLSTQRRIVSPSDDPRGAAQIVTLSQASQVAKQYADNRATVNRHLKTEANQLTNVNNALQAAKPLLVQAGTGTLSDANRGSVATALQGVYDQLLSSANSKDGNGRYIFGGYKTDTQPFAGSPGAVTYQGDLGQRLLQVDGSRQMALNDPGSSVFTSTTASAAYIATAATTNSGSAIYKGINVADASASDFGHNFDVTFAVTGGKTTYTVTDSTSGTTGPSQPYVAGNEIALGSGLKISVAGTPTDGDRFTVAKGRPQDNNILNALSDVIGTLRQPVSGDVSQARLT